MYGVTVHNAHTYGDYRNKRDSAVHLRNHRCTSDSSDVLQDQVLTVFARIFAHPSTMETRSHASASSADNTIDNLCQETKDPGKHCRRSE